MKKIISVVTAIAATVALGSATFMNANAMYISLDKNSEKYAEFMEEYTEVDDSGLFESWGWFDSPYEPSPYKVYYRKSTTGGHCFIYDEIMDNRFSFIVFKNTDDYDTVVQGILDKFTSEYEVSVIDTMYDDYSDCAQYTVIDKNLDSDILKSARDVCSELKEIGIVKEFCYYGDVSYPIEISCDYITGYEGLNSEDATIIEEYVSENNLNCKVIKVSYGDEEFWGNPYDGYDGYCVVPNAEITVYEHLALSKQIYDNLGYFPYAISPEESLGTYATVTDLFNTVFGDITADDAVDLYDVIEIAKSLMGTRIFTDSEQLIADFNNDGEVDLYDAIGIAKTLIE